MIRAEKDKEVIKKFNSSQKNIYYSWKNRKAPKEELSKEELIEQQKTVQNIFRGISNAQNKNK